MKPFQVRGRGSQSKYCIKCSKISKLKYSGTNKIQQWISYCYLVLLGRTGKYFLLPKEFSDFCQGKYESILSASRDWNEDRFGIEVLCRWEDYVSVKRITVHIKFT
jgi:hypothetical protein